MLSSSGIGSHDRSNSNTPTSVYGHTLSPPPPVSAGKRDSQSQTSVAVKVLRFISSSLLPPLLDKLRDDFTHELFQSIVVAIQKVSWKVEACLSMCSTIDMCNVHGEVFSEKILTEKIRNAMIASPPEDIRIHNSPSHMMTRGLKDDVISLEDSDMEAYWEKQRRRDNSIGNLISANETGKEGYFRPGRRTTVSISKKQVKSLGLNVVDATAPDSLSPKRSNTVANTRNALELVEGSENYLMIRERVLKKLAKEFPQLQVVGEAEEDKRSVTLPLNSTLQVSSTPETTRASSAPLPPIDLGPIGGNNRLRDRHSHEPMSTMDSNISLQNGERRNSLEFETPPSRTASVPSPPSGISRRKDLSPSANTLSKSSSNTLPTKRRKTFVKLVKKKALSFGRGDSKIKHRPPVLRNKSSAEFFTPEDERLGSESPIEQFVLRAHPREASVRSSGKAHVQCMCACTCIHVYDCLHVHTNTVCVHV